MREAVWKSHSRDFWADSIESLRRLGVVRFLELAKDARALQMVGNRKAAKFS
jgi:hypothetical protein